MAEPQSGDELGPYRLTEKLGEGGNAWVWKGTKGQDEVAIKVLKNRKVQSEPYARFRREIETLEQLGDHPGILPVHESYLPEALTEGERAWFAMPLAKRLDEVLSTEALRTVVEAVCAIAQTLAELAEKRRLAHRDIKPQNLYSHDGRWVVGDFGLVRWPDSEALTRPGKVVGPKYYVAYEVMEMPEEAATGPADVYALAKTLWVLAMNATYPLPGYQPPSEQTSVGTMRPHPNAHLLDKLIERASRVDPAARPTMVQFARDLRAWLELQEPEDELVEIAQLAAELREAAGKSLAADEAVRRLEAATLRVFERIQEKLRPLNEAIERSLPRVTVSGADSRVYKYLHDPPGMGEPGFVVAYAFGTTVEEPTDILPLRFRYGGLVELRDDGFVVLQALLYIGNDEEFGAGCEKFGPWQVPVESVEAEAAVAEVAKVLRERVPDRARRFVESISRP